MHGHIGGTAQGTPAEYVFKLWMAHGITTVRDPSAGNGLDWLLDQKKRSAENKITAPRLFAYTAFGQGSVQSISTAQQAQEWVRQNAAKGADGIKFFGASPEVMDAALRENKRLGLRSCCHHAQMDVARWNTGMDCRKRCSIGKRYRTTRWTITTRTSSIDLNRPAGFGNKLRHPIPRIGTK
jgi:hypothetical protein